MTDPLLQTGSLLRKKTEKVKRKSLRKLMVRRKIRRKNPVSQELMKVVSILAKRLAENGREVNAGRRPGTGIFASVRQPSIDATITRHMENQDQNVKALQNKFAIAEATLQRQFQNLNSPEQYIDYKKSTKQKRPTQKKTMEILPSSLDSEAGLDGKRKCTICGRRVMDLKNHTEKIHPVEYSSATKVNVDEGKEINESDISFEESGKQS